MKSEEKLFNFIRKKVPESLSFTDEIAQVLEINYDAAYRRISGKTAVSLQEVLKLMEAFDFSITDVFSDKKDFIRVTKKEGVNSVDKLGEYFSLASTELREISKFQSSEIIYSAKDIPVYYSYKSYRKFKMFAFLNVLSDQFNFKRIAFKDFDNNDYLSTKLKQLEDIYESVATTEIWSSDTLTSSINQIMYFFKSKILEQEDALLIIEDFLKTIQKIEHQCTTGKRGSNNNKVFKFYSNDLLNLNNTIFMQGEKTQKFFVPYTTLSYIKIADPDTCDEALKYLKKQLEFSKQLSGDSALERTIFFNEMYKKINKLKSIIKLG
ncbi:hypothetical protein [Polaribacter ponticola]|uniref:Transcription regulator BetR N-terminal domain-containing protein n=1 Tax=Polaribacter ponticola TaxID=2978475 RepID=A0ABT5SAV8_9FLAO|nr:hypothetical protein [Polaribacter sp. MSW5]MDD7915253.1 hypothetical protein [Polaribacter sp. MSW5]